MSTMAVELRVPRWIIARLNTSDIIIAGVGRTPDGNFPGFYTPQPPQGTPPNFVVAQQVASTRDLRPIARHPWAIAGVWDVQFVTCEQPPGGATPGKAWTFEQMQPVVDAINAALDGRGQEPFEDIRIIRCTRQGTGQPRQEKGAAGRIYRYVPLRYEIRAQDIAAH